MSQDKNSIAKTGDITLGVLIEDGLIPRDAKDYKCEYCGKGEFTKHSLQRHIKSNHQRNERKYKFSLSKQMYFIQKYLIQSFIQVQEYLLMRLNVLFVKQYLKRHT